MGIRESFVCAVVAPLLLGGCPSQSSSPGPAPSSNPASSSSVAPPPTIATADAAASPESLATTSVLLPGATGPLSLDYLACDRVHGRVLIPVGNTGSLDVFDIAKNTFTRVDGFKTAERESRGKNRLMGPSAISFSDDFLYVGNRATSEVCAIPQTTLKLGACFTVPSPTDGVAFVASAKEVWVTTPRDQTITVLDAKVPDVLKAKLAIKTDGEPEGYAVDDARGIFYTNLEDKNRTLAIDIKTHKVTATWNSGCGSDGPRGIAIDRARNFVFVACTDGLRLLDANHDGAVLGKIDTGAGVDNIEFLDSKNLLYAAAGKAARITVARIGEKGEAAIVATGATAARARNAVVDANGNAYVVDPESARLLIVAAPSSH